MILSTPAAVRRFATSLAPIETRGLSLRSCLAHPKYGITAMTLSAEALLAASIVSRSSIRFSVGGKVDCRMNTVAPLTLSVKEGTNSPSLNLVTSEAPRWYFSPALAPMRFSSSTTLHAKSLEALQANNSILCSMCIKLCYKLIYC